MPTAVPIAFPNQQRHGSQGSDSAVENPIMISPNMQWRGSPMSMSYSILARSFGKGGFSAAAMMGTPGSFNAAFNELNDFRVNGVPSSLESEAGKILRALHGEQALDKNLTQNYACCGFELPDLHALLEHFEEYHVVVVDSPSLGPTRPGTAIEASSGGDIEGAQSAFDPDAMDLDSAPSSSASSPPSTPPMDATPTSAVFDNTAILRASRGLAKSSMSGYNTPRGISPHPDGLGEGAFNPYASYSDFSALMPGTVRTPIHQSPPMHPSNAIKNGNGSASQHGSPTQSKCIPPALLFSPGATPSGSPTQSSSRDNTPMATHGNPLSRAGSLQGGSSSGILSGGITSASLMSLANQTASSSNNNPNAKKNSISGAASSSGGGGGSSSSLVSKPFRCPTIGCNKSYKQANGLKYHITHGQCNFMPRDPALEGLNESEADEKARPYVCQVGSCTRRYKNMNGLRYHYQHSGQHGAVGLALLASGQHSLQTGLKDVGLDLSPQVKEQHLLAAQALQRSQQQALQTQQQMQSQPTPTPAPSIPQPAYLSQLQQQQAAEQARIHQHESRLPAQKTPPAALTSLMTAGGVSRPSVATTTAYTPSPTAIRRDSSQDFAMQM